MKKLLFLLMLSSSIYAQDKFEWSNKITDYVTADVNGTAPQIYPKAVNWIKENYVNPNEVIKMTIENEKIRLQGFKKDFNCFGGACADGTYTIEISFKDGKYKFDPIDLKLSNSAGSFDFPLNTDLQIYYNKKGELRKGSKEALDNVVGLFNGLNESLKNYINGTGKKEDW
ncbi:hypothetical protein [Flavobacterium sp. 25HG05S-40]|uniref:hypothetical protein n=1 Tax=Flavobacterium sp. 25HG05S-40 TaxID=3458682 RepID=UPI004044D44D